ncbi:ABC transporter substrate-binding protein [Sphingomonas arenae]|uniref:ABC transporter substrate-binding protein n=1 Tax=Sphingomonas arenae TaxID=2812555 RepID=UPI00196779DC|nr:ABC transporter substrate-binding protein [Sphingomonas arenae]
MPASGLALAASATLRAASLNLCTDEYLLLLARPQEIVSVSHLSRDPLESTLWRQARRHPANSGSLEGVVAHRPTLVLTMGGAGRASGLIAQRLGIRVLDLPYPATLADVERQTLQVAAALGDPRRALTFRRALAELRSTRPTLLRDAAFLSAGGLSFSPDSLGARWMTLAGARQRALPRARLSLEELATRPPSLLIRSTYRAGQMSRGQAWMTHPAVRRLGPRTISTDGRPWTCAGLPMIAEVRRLRERMR